MTAALDHKSPENTCRPGEGPEEPYLLGAPDRRYRRAARVLDWHVGCFELLSTEAQSRERQTRREAGTPKPRVRTLGVLTAGLPEGSLGLNGKYGGTPPGSRHVFVCRESTCRKVRSSWALMSATSRRLLLIVSATLLISTLGWYAEANAWQLTANWVGDTTGAATGYSLERATGTSGTYAQIATTAAGVAAYTDSAATPGQPTAIARAHLTALDFQPTRTSPARAPAVTAVTVYRQSTGQWFSLLPTAQIITVPYGCMSCGDVPVPADYDGDGTTDVTVYRPSTGTWYIQRSSTGTTQQVQWGAPGDVPVPGDYDGDGKADIAVYRPSDGFWYILRSSDGATQQVQWEPPATWPSPATTTATARPTSPVYRPSGGFWFIHRSSDGTTQQVQWGAPGDVPVRGDFDGDGKTDIAVYRPSGGFWFILRSSDGSLQQVQWGASGDVSVTGDFDGDGKTDVGVYRPSTGTWYIQRSSTGTTMQVQWEPSAIQTAGAPAPVIARQLGIELPPPPTRSDCEAQNRAAGIQRDLASEASSTRRSEGCGARA